MWRRPGLQKKRLTRVHNYYKPFHIQLRQNHSTNFVIPKRDGQTDKQD